MYQKLREKGWTDKELDHLQKHFRLDQEHSLLPLLGLVLLLIGAIAVPYAYGRIGWALPDGILFATLAFIGIPLGAMFGFLMIDFERLEHHHHIGIIFLLPIAVLIGVLGAFTHLNSTAPAGAFTHNALIGAIVYAVALVAPYAAMVMYEWNSRIGSSNT